MGEGRTRCLCSAFFGGRRDLIDVHSWIMAGNGQKKPFFCHRNSLTMIRCPGFFVKPLQLAARLLPGCRCRNTMWLETSGGDPWVEWNCGPKLVVPPPTGSSALQDFY